MERFVNTVDLLQSEQLPKTLESPPIVRCIHPHRRSDHGDIGENAKNNRRGRCQWRIIKDLFECSIHKSKGIELHVEEDN